MSTVLLVDDSKSLRQVVTMALSSKGYGTVEATDGEDALLKLNSHHIDMIICDVNMPVLNGFDFVSKMRENPKYKFTPVLMLTTEATDDKKNTGRKVGASGWLVKPFSPTTLLKAVSKFIG